MASYSVDIEDEITNTTNNTVDAHKLARKIRRKRHKLLIADLFMDFSKNTTLHGLKYINEKGLTYIEKIFWFLTFCASVGLCFYLIFEVFVKWKTSPVIVSFSEQMVPVGKVPFPSVTICPQWKCRRSAYNFSAMIIQYHESIEAGNRTNFTSTEMMQLQDISLLCEDIDGTFAFDVTEEPRNKSMIENILQASSATLDMFLAVDSSWTEGGDYYSLFHRVLTTEGVCYNFNSLSAKEIFNENGIQKDYDYLETRHASKGWTLKDGYIKNFPMNVTYPKRGRGTVSKPDMTIYLSTNRLDHDPVCNPLNNGFKIFLHHPTDLPHSSVYYYAALPKQISSLALKFNSLTTSDRLKGYSPLQRQCYFPNDRHLRYFKIYTQKNCMIECMSNYTFAHCGCVSYEMPHNDSKQLCHMTKMGCVRQAKDDLADRETRASLDTKGEGSCHCLPTCDSISYDAEILKTEFHLKQHFKNMDQIYKMNDSEYYNNLEFSAIELYFKESQFVSMRRSELFGITDFLANCGGLLGLFLGFSFLSLVEIFYFLTLRFCCLLRKDLMNEKES